ncbi:MAG: molybdopterin cofactor-binding domain-containing protein [Halioglobus sp.]
MSIKIISRREFMKLTGIAGGSLVLGGSLSSAALAESGAGAVKKSSQLGHFVSIANDGQVTIVCQRGEMGQGIVTSVPQIIADEMGADWDHVTAVLGGANPDYGNQSTGGSASIRVHYEFTRRMGAVARELLEQAAANEWQVDKAQVRAQDHAVVHLPSNRKLSFAELAKKAALLEMPDPYALTLRKDDELKLTGKDVKLQSHEELVRGKLLYAQDVQIPGMLIASIQRPPTVGGKVKSFDATAAKKVAGVVDVIQLRDRSFPVMLNPLSGVAVVATNTWAAQEARKKLVIEWELGPNAVHNSYTYLEELVSSVESKGAPIRTQGDVYSHQYDAERTLEATYTIPYHNHSPMETPAATAVIEDGVCTIWTGTQSPQRGKSMALAELGYNEHTDSDKVVLHNTFMGGAFGRKGKDDFTIEAVELAKATGKPVKVIWTREDDTRHGFYHSMSANYYKAELSEDNQSADNFISRVAHPAISALFDHTVKSPSPGSHSQSFGDLPFDLKNLSVEKTEAKTHVRIGWFRAVQNIHNAFAMSCFVDELAAKANLSTQKMWLNLIGKDRKLDHKALGFDAWSNYGHKAVERLPDTARMKAVINTLHEKVPVTQSLPENEGWGIGFCSSFASYSAAATKVRVTDGKLEVLEMHTVIDCGKVITPDRVRSQMEGAMIMGLAVALYSEITVKDGAVEQGNFDTYPVARMNQVPPLHVHIIASDKPPGGVGEPGFPSIAPSIVNAVFHASGERYRDLPLNKVMTV